MEEGNRPRTHSSRMRQIEQRLESLEKNIKGLPESLREKDSSKAMETTAQEILDTTKKLKEEMEFLRNAPEEMPEERKKSFEKSLDFNNNTVVWKETSCCENELAAGRTPNALGPNDSPTSQDRHEDVRFTDRATSPVNLMHFAEIECKFPVRVLLGTG